MTFVLLCFLLQHACQRLHYMLANENRVYVVKRYELTQNLCVHKHDAVGNVVADGSAQQSGVRWRGHTGAVEYTQHFTKRTQHQEYFIEQHTSYHDNQTISRCGIWCFHEFVPLVRISPFCSFKRSELEKKWCLMLSFMNFYSLPQSLGRHWFHFMSVPYHMKQSWNWMKKRC